MGLLDQIKKQDDSKGQEGARSPLEALVIKRKAKKDAKRAVRAARYAQLGVDLKVSQALLNQEIPEVRYLCEILKLGSYFVVALLIFYLFNDAGVNENAPSGIDAVHGTFFLDWVVFMATIVSLTFLIPGMLKRSFIVPDFGPGLYGRVVLVFIGFIILPKLYVFASSGSWTSFSSSGATTIGGIGQYVLLAFCLYFALMLFSSIPFLSTLLFKHFVRFLKLIFVYGQLLFVIGMAVVFLLLHLYVVSLLFILLTVPTLWLTFRLKALYVDFHVNRGN